MKLSCRKETQEFSAWCEKRYPGFKHYFAEHYLRQPEQWATCFRKGKGINTNMVTEAFHNVLKGVYFQRKQNKRIDHLLCILLKIARDKVSDALIKDQKGKRTYKHRETDKRHKRAVEIEDKEITEIFDRAWQVQSQKDKSLSYTIKRNKSGCNCKVKCTFCQVCQHNYTCTCTDFSVRAIACKHVHAVHLQQHCPEMIATDEAPDTHDQVQEEEHDVKYFETIMKQDTKYTEGQGEIENLKSKIFSKLEELSSLIESSKSASALQGCIAHLNSTITVTEGLSSLEGEHSYFAVKQRCPPNKKFDIQPRFEKTKKKSKRQPNLVTKPTIYERNALQKAFSKQTPTICGICFKEDDSTGKEDNEWVQCPMCGLWAHSFCEKVEDADDYVMCSICERSVTY